MKNVRAACSVIKKENKYFCTQRGHGVRKGLWEFPGGHIEENETGEDACIREMIEELNATVSVNKYLGTVEHDYEDFHLSMDAFLCSLISDYNLNEALDSKWIPLDELDSIPWCDADKKVVELIKENEK